MSIQVGDIARFRGEYINVVGVAVGKCNGMVNIIEYSGRALEYFENDIIEIHKLELGPELRKQLEEIVELQIARDILYGKIKQLEKEIVKNKIDLDTKRLELARRN